MDHLRIAWWWLRSSRNRTRSPPKRWCPSATDVETEDAAHRRAIDVHDLHVNANVAAVEPVVVAVLAGQCVCPSFVDAHTTTAVCDAAWADGDVSVGEAFDCAPTGAIKQSTRAREPSPSRPMEIEIEFAYNTIDSCRARRMPCTRRVFSRVQITDGRWAPPPNRSTSDTSEVTRAWLVKTPLSSIAEMVRRRDVDSTLQVEQ